MKKQKPFYKSIAEELERDIKDKKYKSGEKMPAERVIQERFFVSRMTARQAYHLLEKKGLITIEKNRGAFVSDISVKRSQEILGFTELMESKGFTCRSKVLNIERKLPDAKVQKKLKLEDGEEVYYIFRYRYANEELVAIERAYVVASMVPKLEMFNFEEYSLYDTFYWHYNLNLSYAKDEIFADMIIGKDAEMMLNTKKGPALVVQNSSFVNDNIPLEYTETIYNYKVFSYTIHSTRISKRHNKEEE